MNPYWTIGGLIFFSCDRSIYLSVFEIHSEKGKGEKLSDLTPDGSDIYMQQSAVKGLKEVRI